MAPCFNLTDILGDFDRNQLVGINPLAPRSVPIGQNPAFIVPLILGLIFLFILLSFATCMLVYARREKRRLRQIETDMSAAARIRGIETGTRSNIDGLLTHRGIIYHYNYQTKDYERVAVPSTPHFDTHLYDSVSEASYQMMAEKMEKCWRGTKKMFVRG